MVQFKSLIEDLQLNFDDVPIVIGGDINARVGAQNSDVADIFADTFLYAERLFSDQNINNRGLFIYDFMSELGFILLNGRTASDYPSQWTFCNSNGMSVIDLVWISQNALTLVKDLRVLSDFTSLDHFPVLLELLTNEPNVLEHQSPSSSCPSYKWKPDASHAYLMYLAAADCSEFFNSDDVNYRSSFLTELIKEAASYAGLRKDRKTPNNFDSKPWFDHDCVNAKKTVSECLKKCFKVNFQSEDKLEYLRAKKYYKEVTKAKKEKYIEDLRTKFSNVRNSLEFWKAVRCYSPRPRLQKGPSIESWNNFYRNAYPNVQCVPLPNGISRVSELDLEITFSELDRYLKHLKTGKAPGPDLINNEFYAHLPTNLKICLLSLFNRIFEMGRVPENWSHVLLTMIFKSGDRLDPLNYRGIALVNSVTKIFTEILRARLESWAEKYNVLPMSQFGFRRNRSCIDAYYVLQSVLRFRLRLALAKAYALFVDFKRAFDSVPQDKLWAKLINLGVSTKIIHVLKSLYDSATVQVRQEQEPSYKFRVTEGVLQGESLCPLLFILFLSDIEEFFRKRNCTGLNLNNISDILMLLYADDMVLLASSPKDLEAIIKTLEKYCDINGLTVNTSKTKVMVFREHGRLKQRLNERFVYNKEKLEITSCYKYLGIEQQQMRC
ncbi:uncharacterized protein LOC130673891 [Microplitis mediator]|uniref:uncharacterized protein LOC130673891 n=1 Tax=Microplitis mediator TaxID=375433 RepID=UPI002553DB67|nr:uncharacterized protein LOC130673891 [Microplitis mediator]